jgi:glutathione S-transferase
MAEATLLISSRNYSSWSLRGWLLTRMSGLPFTVESVSADDPAARAELLLRSSSILVPCLMHDGLSIWDTAAIGEYLNETCPEAGILPKDRTERARCRSICGEMHAGFGALRSSLPMNLRSRRTGFRIWAAAQADIDRISWIWNDCLKASGGPWLFGAQRTMADAMYAPVATRYVTYDVSLDATCAAYRDRLLNWPDMQEWARQASDEPVAIDELEVEF